MASAPIVVLNIGPLDANKDAYPLRYFAEDDHQKPAAEEWIPLAALDGTQPGWNASSVIQRVEADQGASSKFREIGEYLAALLETGTVGAAWRARRQQARGAGGVPVRTALNVEADDLRALPWELMFSDNTWLFRDVEAPMYRAIRKTNKAPDEALPLRVLVVVGARDDEKQKIRWDTELEDLRRGLRASGAAVELEEAIRPDANEVIKLVERVRPHVFHFIGHGELTGNPKEPALVFSGAQNRFWTGTLMRQDFATARWRPPVILFNACRSAAAKENTTELAGVLIADGTCCVIGMQGDIRGEASAAFAASLYEGILKRRPIDVAIVEARIAVTQKVQETRDWALPAVYVSCTPEEALPSAFGVENAQAVISQFAQKFKELSDFVDRRDERRDLCWRFLQQNQQLQRENLVVLYGSEKVGKSDVVRWCTRHLVLRGRNVRYVDLDRDDNSGETRTILAAIRRGVRNATGTVLGPLADAPFAVFDRKLEALERGRPEGGSEPIAQLCETFVTGLKELTKNEELVIVLDHFHFKVRGLGGTIDPKDFDAYLKGSLFDPVAEGKLPNVKLLLVMREDEMQRDPGQVVGQAKIAIPAWEDAHFDWLARHFAIEALAKDRVNAEQLITIYKATKIAGRWGPAQLREMGDFIRIVVPS